MGKKFKWGIIGLGKIAALFAEDLPKTQNGVLHAVASRSLDKAKVFAQKHNAKHAYGDYHAILDSGELDAVYIATPHSRHYENAMMCLEAGVPVLCEKPFAINSTQLSKMVALAREKNVFLMEALWTRFLPHYIEVKQIVDSGVLGPVTSLKADFGFVANAQDHKRLFKKDLGGGALLDIGIYPIFASLSLLGTPDDIQAKATFGDTGVDTEVDISFRYGNDCEAVLHCSLLEDTPTQLVVVGERGTLTVGETARFHEPSNYILAIKDKQRKTSNFKYNCNGYQYEADEVERCVRDGLLESDLMPLDFSILLMSLLDKVRRKVGIHYLQHDV